MYDHLPKTVCSRWLLAAALRKMDVLLCKGAAGRSSGKIGVELKWQPKWRIGCEIGPGWEHMRWEGR